MVLDLTEKDLKNGLLGLVVALVEIIKEALRLQAVKRMEAGSLTEDEVERLGEALLDLDHAMEKLKVELGVAESVKAVRDGLDRVVADVVDRLFNPNRWEDGQRVAVGCLPTDPPGWGQQDGLNSSTQTGGGV